MGYAVIKEISGSKFIRFTISSDAISKDNLESRAQRVIGKRWVVSELINTNLQNIKIK